MFSVLLLGKKMYRPYLLFYKTRKLWSFEAHRDLILIPIVWGCLSCTTPATLELIVIGAQDACWVCLCIRHCLHIYPQCRDLLSPSMIFMREYSEKTSVYTLIRRSRK